MTARVLRLELPAAHTDVRIARNLVRRFARMLEMKERELEQLVLVVSELLANAIDHGGGGAAMSPSELAGDVRMGCVLRVSEEGWELSVSDQGGGDAEEVRRLIEPPDGLPDLEDDRGRGFFLLATMVDELEVQPSEAGDGLTFTARRRYEGA